MTDTDKICKLNDAFRTSFTGGHVLMTVGIQSKPLEDVAEILSMVQHFNKFTTANDPYQEHDFGKFTFKGDVIMWKIDYYDKNCQYGSENPADEAITTRVLTIMTANEY